jgi:hypothetical protein
MTTSRVESSTRLLPTYSDLCPCPPLPTNHVINHFANPKNQGPKGCDGGDAQPAFAYVVKSGGVAQTQDYPYKGLNGWCRCGLVLGFFWGGGGGRG